MIVREASGAPGSGQTVRSDSRGEVALADERHRRAVHEQHVVDGVGEVRPARIARGQQAVPLLAEGRGVSSRTAPVVAPETSWTPGTYQGVSTQLLFGSGTKIGRVKPR